MENSQYEVLDDDEIVRFIYAATVPRIQGVQGYNDGICFAIETEQFREIIKLSIDENGYYFKHVEGSLISMHLRKKIYDLAEFFQDNPPRIKFVNQSTLEGNYYVTLTEKKALRFDETKIERWEWKEKGVDIRVESQGLEKSGIVYSIV